MTYHWLYVVLPERIDETVVILDPSLVDLVDVATGQYSGPRH
jgi:hypothetical protein